MKGLLVDDRVKVKGTITEVNPDGTYTVELHTSEGGFWELLEDLPRLKLGKALPKKDERCIKCVAALESQKAKS